MLLSKMYHLGTRTLTVFDLNFVVHEYTGNLIIQTNIKKENKPIKIRQLTVYKFYKWKDDFSYWWKRKLFKKEEYSFSKLFLLFDFFLFLLLVDIGNPTNIKAVCYIEFRRIWLMIDDNFGVHEKKLIQITF